MQYNFSHYSNLGLCTIPLRGKFPLSEWKSYQDKRPAEWLVHNWDNTSHNIAIVTGHISGLLVVDIDGEYPPEWPEMPKTWTVETSTKAKIEIKSAAEKDETIHIKIGNDNYDVDITAGDSPKDIYKKIDNGIRDKNLNFIHDNKLKIVFKDRREHETLEIKSIIPINYTDAFLGRHFYFHLPSDKSYNNATSLTDNVDIRANGGYVVAPPSLHPEGGGHYNWKTSPSDVKLETIPEWLDELLSKKSDPYTPKNTNARPVNYESDKPWIDAMVKGQLEELSNTSEGSRNNQLNIAAYRIARYLPASDVEKILKPVALSIGLSPIEIDKTIQSAIKSAPPGEIPNALPDAQPPPAIVRNILEREGKKISTSEISPKLIEGAPGLPGEISSWILSESMFPLPVLSLAASITCAGMIMGHRICGETNLRTNFFTMGIAESGGGKEQARKCIKRLLRDSGLNEYTIGDPASAQGVINSIASNQRMGRGIMLIDEFGRYIEGINNPRAAAYLRQIPTNMMHMYNHASSFFTGNELADNEAQGGRKDIDQPCLGIYATTTPDRFYKNLTRDETFDGFLSRWLIFETSRFDIEPTNFDSFGISGIPDSLTGKMRWWQEQPTYSGSAEDNMAMHTMIQPRVVMFSDDVRRSFRSYLIECRKRSKSSDNIAEKAFWNRAAEHTAKLALVCHEGDYISSNVWDWAEELVTALTVSTIENVKSNISENQYEADMNRVLKIIKETKSATLSHIVQKTRNIDRRRRFDILDTLIEAGDIIKEESDTGGKRPATIYRTLP